VQKNLPRSLKALSLTIEISSVSVHNRLFWAGNQVKVVSARHCYSREAASFSLGSRALNPRRSKWQNLNCSS